LPLTRQTIGLGQGASYASTISLQGTSKSHPIILRLSKVVSFVPCGFYVGVDAENLALSFLRYGQQN
jgi:hypothetical protein